MKKLITKTLKNASFYIRVDPSEKQKVEADAKRRGMRVSAYIRKTLMAAK